MPLGNCGLKVVSKWYRSVLAVDKAMAVIDMSCLKVNMRPIMYILYYPELCSGFCFPQRLTAGFLMYVCSLNVRKKLTQKQKKSTDLGIVKPGSNL